MMPLFHEPACTRRALRPGARRSLPTLDGSKHLQSLLLFHSPILNLLNDLLMSRQNALEHMSFRWICRLMVNKVSSST